MARSALARTAEDVAVRPNQRRTALLVGVWLALAAFLILRQLSRETPDALVDELVYGRVAQNLAHGEGFTYQGLPSRHYSIYPFLVAPAWAFFESTTAYHVALAINGAIMTTVFFPAYAIARRVTSFWWAVAAGSGAAVAPSMVWAGMLMTEALAYPLAALALLAITTAVRELQWRSFLTALAAIVAATVARPQLFILLPVLAAAATTAAFIPGRRRDGERLWRRRRLVLLCAGVTLAVIALAVLGVRGGFLGTYTGFVQTLPNAGDLAHASIRYVTVLMIASLGLPVIAALVLALRRSNWLDHELAPVLAVAVPVTIGLIILGAWFSITVSPELRERYVFYATPVLAACWVALPGRTGWKPLALITGVVALYMLPVVPTLGGTGEFVQYTLANITRKLPGLGSDGWADEVAGRVQLSSVWILVLGGLAAFSTRLNGRAAAVALLAPTLISGFAILNVRQSDVNRQSAIFAAKFPQPPDWIDRETEGPVAVVMTGHTSFLAVWHFELWNRNVERVFRLERPAASGVGQACPLRVGGDGSLALVEKCAGRGLPRYLVFFDPWLRISLGNARLVRTGDEGVQLYELQPDRPPRVVYLVERHPR